MHRGHCLVVLAALLLLVGAEASRVLTQNRATTAMCLDPASNAVVKQGTKMSCRGYGMKMCGMYGYWSTITGKCNDWDLSQETQPDGRVIRFGPRPDQENAQFDANARCVDLYNSVVVNPGDLPVRRCMEGGGSKQCGKFGKWDLKTGPCTDFDLGITRHSDGSISFVRVPAKN